LVTSLSSSVLTDAGYGYLLTSDDDADTDFQALTRADGTQVPWWPLSPDVGEAEAHLFTPHGLLVEAETGGGGLVANEEVVALLDYESGEQLWSISRPEGYTEQVGYAYSADADTIIVVGTSSLVGYTSSGDVAFRVANEHAELKEGYISVMEGTRAEKLLIVLGDRFYTCADCTDDTGVMRARSAATGQVMAVDDRQSGDDPVDTAPFPNLWNRHERAVTWLDPQTTADLLETESNKLLRLGADGEVVWSVEIGNSSLWGSSAQHVFLNGPTDDLVVLDATDGSQVLVLPSQGPIALSDCNEAEAVSETVMALDCRANDINYVPMITI
jgi:outer membrane protein assembly factor BamB